jgi:putative endonuclease
MFYAYILRSKKTGRYYYGSSGDISRRIQEHNSGKVASTKSGAPWILHYYEEYGDKPEATGRERYFKRRSGYRWLKSKGII